jgi:6-phosphofructokinase 1
VALKNVDFTVSRLGECTIASPMPDVRFVRDEERLLYHSRIEEVTPLITAGNPPPTIEVAGPRERIYFDPRSLACAIVTCGGLCPGLNDIIRSIVMSLFHHYGVTKVIGFRYGYEGLSPHYGHRPMELTPEVVARIHDAGGTILGSSRGPQDVTEMVDTLEDKGIGILFAVGGDGTLRGAHAISEEIRKRGLRIAIIGVPKTIDNDISYIQQTFGFDTAVAEARRVTYAAHSEAEGARNGVGLVKLMGRDSGFIAAYAVLADTQVNFCLVPEVPFTIDGLLAALRRRLSERGHAVIVVAEGAGQELLETTAERDASGNVRFGDIGIFLKDTIKSHFAGTGTEMTLKYIDPSYMIRSLPANARDSAFCLLLGHNAVHAAMTGRTDLVLGVWHGEFTHVPIPLAVSARKKIDPEGPLWNSVLAATGQPRDLYTSPKEV